MKVFIPIKETSQRVPKKNFRSFEGKPLYKHALYKLKDFEVYVDTDSDKLLEEIQNDKELSHVTPYIRAEYLTGHTTSVCKLIEYFIEKFHFEDLVVCQVHVTSPFLKASTLEKACRFMQNGYDSVVSCNALQTRLWRKEAYGMCPVNHNPMKLEQTQDLSTLYEENSLFYIFKSEILMKTGNRIGHKPYFYVTSHPESLDIDTEEDWSLIKKMENNEH